MKVFILSIFITSIIKVSFSVTNFVKSKASIIALNVRIFRNILMEAVSTYSSRDVDPDGVDPDPDPTHEKKLNKI